MEKLELIFTHERPIKNTVRYKEELGEVVHSSRDIAISSLYVRKQALREPVPQRMRAIIEPEPASG